MQHEIKTGVPYQDDEDFYEMYYGTTLEKCERVNIEPTETNSDLEIYITTFDGLLYVKYQIKTLRKFLPNGNIVICDTNSHVNSEVSKKTKDLCIKEGISYIKMPHNKMQDVPDFSTKLGVDMTWIFRNCVRIRKPKYFGFLDQDCFLLKEVWGYLKSYLDKKKMYGLSWESPNRISDDGKKYWLVHIMQNFFKYDFVKDLDLDFRPAGHIGLDTGGCNYFSLFKDFNCKDYEQTETMLSDFVKEKWEFGDIFRDYSLHDNERWVHIRNSTKKVSEHPNERYLKEMYMIAFLNGILLK